MLKRLSDKVSVSAQLSEAEVQDLAAKGVVAIINNRPDGEAPDQPGSDDIAAIAEAAGMAYHHIPIVGGAVSREAVEDMATALDDADGPVVAFCRSGTRSTMLWALTRAGKEPADAIIAAAAEAGYDVSPLRPYLEGMDPHG